MLRLAQLLGAPLGAPLRTPLRAPLRVPFASTRLSWSLPSRSASSFALRDYQKECIEACSVAFKKYNRIAVSMPTGSGKTATFLQLLDTIKPKDKRRVKHIIVVPRKEIVEQVCRHAAAVYPHKKVAIEMAKHHAPPDADIIVASVSSLCRETRLARFDPAEVASIIIDEAHHAAAPSYRKILNHFGASSADSPVKVIGFSATLSRHDGLALDKSFDYIAFHKDLPELIHDQYLCPIKFTTVLTNVDLAKVRKSRNDFVTASLAKVIDSPELNALVFNAWKYHPANSTLVFCVDIGHAENVADIFRGSGVDAHVVTSNTPADVRRDLIARFSDGDIPVLVNCAIFTEGTDIPNIDLIILDRPTRSPGLLMQMIGRGLRKHASKSACRIIDMFGTTANVEGLATVPLLAGLDPDSIEKVVPKTVTMTSSVSISPGLPEPIVNVFLENFDSFEELLEARERTRAKSVPAAGSRYNWISVNKSTHLLIGDGGYLRLCADKGKGKSGTTYSLYKYRPAPRFEDSPANKHIKHFRQTLFSGQPNFKSALNAADLAAAQAFPSRMILRSAKWRTEEPSPAQKRALDRILSRQTKAPAEIGRIISTMNKGQAANLINLHSVGYRTMLDRLVAPPEDPEPTEPAYQPVQVGPMAKAAPRRTPSRA